MGGVAGPCLPQIKHSIMIKKQLLSNTSLSLKANSFIQNKQKKVPICESDKKYDLVYILKESESNPDLKMSLRSIAQFCTFKNIWLVGYKPNWVQNVKFLKTEQTGTKWQNAMINMIAACKCNEISEDFVLMNDDFFALDYIRDWKKSLNLCLGTLEKQVLLYSAKKNKSRWQYGFEYAVDLLDSLDCKRHLNYESHLPIIFNRNKFLEMCELEPIKKFINTNKVLHRRSVYKNLYPDIDLEEPVKIRDVKISIGRDLNDAWLHSNWLSVFDNVTDNVRRYPRINKFLNSMYPTKCMFEV